MTTEQGVPDPSGTPLFTEESLARYAFRQVRIRLIQVAVLVFGVTTLLFFLLRLTGDPAVILVGDLATQEQVDQVREFYGLDRPLILQYLTFLGQALRLDFGNSLTSLQPAMDLVLERLPATLWLALAAITINVLGALAVGTWLGYRPDKLTRRVGLLSVVVSQGIPAFVIGLILIQLFAVTWRLLPSIGNEGFSSVILPAITLASFLLPRVIRLTATNVDTAMRQDYIRTARASGARPGEVLVRHAMPNALLGTVALIGVQFGFLVSGSLITESMFAWPGLGRLLIESVRDLDFPVVLASVAVVAVLVFLVNLLVDLLLPVIDPRLRAQRA